MEGLLAEINKKKTEDFASSSSGNKYLKRGDLERQKEEEAARRRDEERKRKAQDDDAESDEKRARKQRKEAEAARVAALSTLRESRTATPETGSPAPPGSEEKEKFNVSPEECVRRLRAKGQPIRLFGETDKDRRLRLRALELLEERGVNSQVDFKRAIKDLDQREQERRARADLNQKTGDKDEEKMRKYTSEPIDLDNTEFNQLHPIIYWNFKSILKEWGDSLDARPEEVKRTTQGKLAAATQVQSAQNLKPLFKGLRTRELSEDVVRLLAEVVYHMQQRNYQKANDAYLRLSIGNAAWPLGVTSVGMHARSNDNRTVNNVAHVLNDEVSRKYIQAVKRLMTFAQNARPAISKALMMG